MKLTTFLAIIGSASAFVPATKKSVSLSLGAALEELPGNSKPIKSFDPFGLAGVGSDETFAWFRAAELKHSRVAMLASTGFLVQSAGIHFPFMLSKDISCESLSSLKAFDQWAQVPDAGKAQILLGCLVCEIATESQGTHYMKGGALPTLVFPPVDFSGVDAVTLKRKQTAELNNGRLAMIAIMSFIAETNIPGSVPVLSKIGSF